MAPGCAGPRLGVFEGAAILQVGGDPGRPKRAVGDDGSETGVVGTPAMCRAFLAARRRCPSGQGNQLPLRLQARLHITLGRAQVSVPGDALHVA